MNNKKDRKWQNKKRKFFLDRHILLRIKEWMKIIKLFNRNWKKNFNRFNKIQLIED